MQSLLRPDSGLNGAYKNGFRQRLLFAVVIHRSRVHSVHLCDQASGALPGYSRDRGVTRHAEIAAAQEIVRVGLRGASIVLFQLRNGLPEVALPCECCMRKLFRGFTSDYRVRVYARGHEEFEKIEPEYKGVPSSAARAARRHLRGRRDL